MKKVILVIMSAFAILIAVSCKSPYQRAVDKTMEEYGKAMDKTMEEYGKVMDKTMNQYNDIMKQFGN